MRPPTIEDVPWIHAAYADWPPTPRRGYATFDKVEKWVQRWIHRDDELCYVEPGIGLVTYRIGPFSAVIDNIVVHPEHREQGHATAMIEWLTKHLFDEGVLVATFKTLPGPIANKYPEGVVTAWQ